jgi:hypothetical protein
VGPAHRRRGGDIGENRIDYAGPEKVELASVSLGIEMPEIDEGVPKRSLLKGPGQDWRAPRSSQAWAARHPALAQGV